MQMTFDQKLRPSFTYLLKPKLQKTKTTVDLYNLKNIQKFDN